ncbi:transposase, IS30 family [Ruegeria halocynthiae]|uniref:Transposase, IS30 family n=1 Tax=Ruegeria halocynthiae TaxID=985054 RepID=A0A1H3EVQ7_9RHOB|nr:IS30 family transposase [Ruegeria halocynthiae]SDX82851.1 transposase, IS30 family [Ruegeria halocynthiae]
MGTVYSQLSIEERRRIERWRHARVPVREMARVLKRSKATINRELKRNYFSDPCLPKCDGYYCASAHRKAADRRARQRKLIRYPQLRECVVEWLKNGWTPEQIGNRMIYEGAMLRVCQETIYRYIYAQEGMTDELWWYLPEHRMCRRPRRARKRQAPKFDCDVSIPFRPDDVAHRRQFGHWEGD